MRLGVDIGRVIMCPASDDGRPDTSFLTGTDEDAMSVPAAPGCFDALQDFVRLTSGDVWLVSKAGKRIEELTRKWFVHHEFFRKTGMAPEHVEFCRKREEKAVIAARLGLTHFVDDRVDVLGHLHGVVPHLYLFGHQKPGWVDEGHYKRVLDWKAAHAELLEHFIGS